MLWTALPSLSSFILYGMLDLGTGALCNENIDLCVFALTLADVSCRFPATIRSQIVYGQFVGHTEPCDNEVKVGAASLGGSSGFALAHGHTLPSECSCCLRGWCCSHRGPKPEVPTPWHLWIHH